jgi:hypothetical protein
MTRRRRSKLRTIEEFQETLHHIMAAFYDVPIELRIKALRAKAVEASRLLRKSRHDQPSPPRP